MHRTGVIYLFCLTQCEQTRADFNSYCVGARTRSAGTRVRASTQSLLTLLYQIRKTRNVLSQLFCHVRVMNLELIISHWGMYFHWKFNHKWLLRKSFISRSLRESCKRHVETLHIRPLIRTVRISNDANNFWCYY